MKMKFLSQKDIKLLVRSVSYVKPYKKRFILLAICLFISILLSLVGPELLGKITAAVLSSNYKTAARIIVQVIALNIVIIVNDLLKSYNFSYINNNIIYKINNELYSKIINLSVKAFDEMRIGEFMSRLSGDAGALTNVITNQFLNTLLDIVKVVVLGIILIKINSILALITIIAFPFTYIIFGVFGRLLRSKSKNLRELYDSQFSIMQQSFFGVRDIKSLGIKKYILNKFNILSKQIKLNNTKLLFIESIADSVTKLISFISLMTIILIGGYLIYLNKLKVEEFITFFLYSSQFSNSLRSVSRLNSSLQQLLVSLERIFNVLDNNQYNSESFGKLDIYTLEGNIKFTNVTFSYDKNKHTLKNLNIHIKSNTKVAIVGQSGAGKTTIFNLLLRFYEPLEGMISIGDVDIKLLTERCLRDTITIIPQRPYLFNMTIKENLLIVKPLATDEEIKDVSKKACIHEFIDKLPNKYNTIIGENGLNLSVGQIQRIAIARGLLKDSKIILFDEATSALDNESQYFIKKAVNNISKERTVVIIAHRLSTIFDCDEILVLDEGNIIAQGKHESLIHNNKIYRKLYQAEFDISKDIS